ncbi:MAG: universal stress protein [Magnetococcales bacterium]|nr:universal stress protein [Magnetococcales bacterium]
MVESSGPGAASLLLAHHGTPGACAAEPLAWAMARAWQCDIVHLWVLPSFWRDMMGDDWLNSAATRATFATYLEQTLSREIEQQQQALQQRCLAQGLRYRFLLQIGEPTACLLHTLHSETPRALVIGSRRPKGVAGYRSHLEMSQLLRQARVPILLAPWGWVESSVVQ